MGLVPVSLWWSRHRDECRSSFVLQIIPHLLSNAEALPQVCKDRKERGICRVHSI